MKLLVLFWCKNPEGGPMKPKAPKGTNMLENNGTWKKDIFAAKPCSKTRLS